MGAQGSEKGRGPEEPTGSNAREDDAPVPLVRDELVHAVGAIVQIDRPQLPGLVEEPHRRGHVKGEGEVVVVAGEVQQRILRQRKCGQPALQQQKRRRG